MSVTRISNFEARAGMAEKLHAFLKTIVPLVEKMAGCQSCELLRNQQNPSAFVVVEKWNSVEEHRASLKNIPPELLSEAMLLLAGPPTGAYYEPLLAAQFARRA
ncbi:antibiotic biosynthesis monooxygenase family protein [Uliginosibacterium sp. H3]|uniref:Antibiotic biosynthesis monooxygenase family protein n=1 Tax=Uliginosibacterium silvisoli TaxID=3114758 RepID=A0ABU6K3N1_9RHOO|nr:antibiotic biosynthesis monooxygenase family protein [Uliginosibacterium sp. H3]